MTSTLTPKTFTTFDEYLAYDDGTDNRYELRNGVLRQLPPESPENNAIATELFWQLAIAQIVPRSQIVLHTCEIQIPGTRPASRHPDLVILRSQHLLLMKRRLTVTLEMPPPQLVAEVVSPGKENQQRDYIIKRSDYAAVGIPEYWIIDPHAKKVTIMQLDRGAYIEVGVFREEETIVSPTFPDLSLTPRSLFYPQG